MTINNDILAFPTVEDWIAPTLQNGWVNFGNSDPSAGTFDSAGYCKDSIGFVFLKGLLRAGTGTTIFILPVGYRPSLRKIFISYGSSTGQIRIDILPTGVVLAGQINITLSLEGIIFKP